MAIDVYSVLHKLLEYLSGSPGMVTYLAILGIISTEQKRLLILLEREWDFFLHLKTLSSKLMKLSLSMRFALSSIAVLMKKSIFFLACKAFSHWLPEQYAAVLGSLEGVIQWRRFPDIQGFLEVNSNTGVRRSWNSRADSPGSAHSSFVWAV